MRWGASLLLSTTLAKWCHPNGSESTVSGSLIAPCFTVADNNLNWGPVIPVASLDNFGESGVDERRGKVKAATRGLEHPFDEVSDARFGQSERGQLRSTCSSDKHLTGSVDPDLFDGGVVEERLQLSKAGDCVDDVLHRLLNRTDERQRCHHRAAVVLRDGIFYELLDTIGVLSRVKSALADLFPHLIFNDRQSIHRLGLV